MHLSDATQRRMRSTRRMRTHTRVLALAGLLALTGCGGDDDGAVAGTTGGTLRIQAGAAPIGGATCTLTDTSTKALASSVTTSATGSATFTGVGASTGLLLVSCSGGTYTDLASGRTLTAPRLRSHVASPVTGSTPIATDTTTVVTPLTEMAVRLLGNQPAGTPYATVRAWVAHGFGLDDMDINGVVPANLSTTAAADTPAMRHGLALAALAQLELAGTSGATTDALITAFTTNLDSHGYPKAMTLPQAYARALEALLGNTRLKTQLGSAGSAMARTLFDNTTRVLPLATIDYVDADQSPTDEGDLVHVVPPGELSTLAIGGRWMHLGMDVRLGGAQCELFDLEAEEHEESNGEQEMEADCPAQPAGTATLVIRDAGIVVSQTVFEVKAQARPAGAAGRARALQAFIRSDSGTGPVTLTGTVTGLAPTIGKAGNAAAHDYSQPRAFKIKGVVVELLDRSAGDAVLRRAATDDDGRYSFAGVDAGRNVVVRVKAQLLMTRPAGVNTGPVWNITVRDNTSKTGTGNPKALYAIDSPPITTVAGVQTHDMTAAMGFDADGKLSTTQPRQSAPFSILEVAYSAMTKIAVTDPNVTAPDVNVYWSTANVGSSGDKAEGFIGTSHYTGGSDMPGVFILGKADSDTDEFDQGVIGHEFGHWLQKILSADDNPGGSHAKLEFKDATLAYGEGYGTALGGLLMGNPLYIDSSGVAQGSGGISNMDAPTAAGRRKGFYSEESVGYVMYQVGKRHGFTAFWKAVSDMRNDHYAATIFAFLHRFVTANPGMDVADLLTTENIRTTDPLGRLAQGAATDAAIDAAANKSTAPVGAPDLETLYLPLTPSTVAAAAEPVPVPLADAPNFCLNHNLPGAKSGNGLGAIRRFTFTAPFTGRLGAKFADDKGGSMDGKDSHLSARKDRAGEQSVYIKDGIRYVNVEQGAVYTLTFQLSEPELFLGSRCGNKVTLWRLPA